MIVAEVTRVCPEQEANKLGSIDVPGHRKGRVMSSPAACNAPINVRKSASLSQTKAKRGKTMAVKSRITRRNNPASMRLPRLNKPMSKRSSPFGRKKFK